MEIALDGFLYFSTQVRADQITDASLHPPSFRTQYTVTGMVREVRNRRCQSLAVPAEVNATPILLFRIRERVFATEAQCPHQKTSLAMADIEDTSIVCQAHAWKFSLASGACVNHAGDAQLCTFPTMVVEGLVYVGFEQVCRVARPSPGLTLEFFFKGACFCTMARSRCLTSRAHARACAKKLSRDLFNPPDF